MRRAGDRGTARRAASPFWKRYDRLSGACSHSCGAPGSKRGRRVDHRRQRSASPPSPTSAASRARCACLGDHERDRIADMARALRCQRVARRHDHRLDARHRHGAGQWPKIRKVGRSEDAEHARHGARRRRCRCARSPHAHAASARPASSTGPGRRYPRCSGRVRSGSARLRGEAATGHGTTCLILNVVPVGRKPVTVLGAGFHPEPRPEAPPLDSAKRRALGTHPFSMGLQRLRLCWGSRGQSHRAGFRAEP